MDDPITLEGGALMYNTLYAELIVEELWLEK
jgi:hypothetical protein